MDTLYGLLKLGHVISFVFMSVPLFNLITVNERALLGIPFHYYTDRYMENIIKNGAYRCFIFQSSALITGVLLLMFGPLGISALWTNWVILVKTLLLFILMASLSFVHFAVQPRIEKIISSAGPNDKPSDNLAAKLKPLRLLRKRLATFCLFLVLTAIILGLQVYGEFHPLITAALILLAALFALRANRSLVRFGWI